MSWLAGVSVSAGAMRRQGVDACVCGEYDVVSVNVNASVNECLVVSVSLSMSA